MTALSETGELKKTPLFEEHLKLGGKMVGFGGWNLPVYYTSILSEHEWTRRSCGIFDVSHLGEVRVQGKGAFDFLQHRLTNDLRKVAPGRILYNLLLDEKGGVLDDILVCCESAEDYYLIVNAANIETDVAALSAAPASVTVTDQSARTACIAVQGPKAEEILQKMFGFSLKNLNYYAFKEESFSGQPVWVSRSGYTGEDGFEIFCSNEQVVSIWQKLLLEGKSLGVLPAGLGARNTLRLEAGNLLCGSDMDRTTTPLEAGLGFAVSFEKPGGFFGDKALIEQKEKGVTRKIVAFKMLDKRIARDHYKIFSAEGGPAFGGKVGQEIGAVTSGSFAPTCGGNIGLGYVSKGQEAVGNIFEIEIHGQKVPAEVVKRPFVPMKHKKF